MFEYPDLLVFCYPICHFERGYCYRLPWWPLVKATVTIFLLIPYFGVAPYIYKFLIKHYCTRDICSRTLNITRQKTAPFELDKDSITLLQSNEDSNLVEISDQAIITSQIQEEKLVAYQVFILSFCPDFLMHHCIKILTTHSMLFTL